MTEKLRKPIEEAGVGVLGILVIIFAILPTLYGFGTTGDNRIFGLTIEEFIAVLMLFGCILGAYIKIQLDIAVLKTNSNNQHEQHMKDISTQKEVTSKDVLFLNQRQDREANKLSEFINHNNESHDKIYDKVDEVQTNMNDKLDDLKDILLKK